MTDLIVNLPEAPLPMDHFVDLFNKLGITSDSVERYTGDNPRLKYIRPQYRGEELEKRHVANIAMDYGSLLGELDESTNWLTEYNLSYVDEGVLKKGLLQMHFERR